MPFSPELIDRRTYARPIRLVAVVIAALAVVTGGWETLSGELAAGSLAGRVLLATRVVEGLVALAIAFAAVPSRSLHALYAFVWVLALEVAGANLVLMAVLPSALWQALMLVMVSILAPALFSPWSWRWQASLALTVLAVAVVTLSLAVPETFFPGSVAPRVYLVLVATVGVSVLGSWVKEREHVRLLESEVRYRGLFDAAADAIAVLDERGTVLDGNMRLEVLIGAPVSQLHGTSLCRWLEPGVDERGRRPACEELLSGVEDAPRAVSGTLARPDGRTVDVEATLVRMPGTEGPIVQVILRDLSERHAIERRHVQTQRVEAVARLAGGLAHQFNNLLGGILNQATLLRRDARDPGAQGQLDAIAHAARRGERLTKELLRFTPHAAISMAATPVPQVVASITALVRSDAQGRVDLDLAPGLPPIAADPDHLVPALMELIFNAFDATAAQADHAIRLAVSPARVAEGDVRWSGAAPGEYVEFAVIDRGAGMDAATRERLFEPFFTTKPMHEAEGLGLATVYWVVRAHGGAIAIDSAPGGGTTVRLLIPVAEQVEQRAPTAPRTPDGVTVLVVDDDPLIRQTAERALSHFGYRVLTAPDGDGALRTLEGAAPPVDLAILDVVMPGGGAPLMKRIRESHPEMRVLVSSGYGPAGEVRQMIELGARAFLQKPYEIGELQDAVETALT